jgi:hypothetical protein
LLGKTDKDIQDKIDELWNHYFGGQNDKIEKRPWMATNTTE